MGTILRMPMFVFEDFTSQLVSLGLTTYACVVDKEAKSIKDIEFTDGSVIIIGNEANGLTEATKKSANFNITIKMRGCAESLNAAAAAAISIWEMMK